MLSIQPHSFSSFGNLRTLLLNNNNIAELQAGTFDFLAHDKVVININNNPLECCNSNNIESFYNLIKYKQNVICHNNSNSSNNSENDNNNKTCDLQYDLLDNNAGKEKVNVGMIAGVVAGVFVLLAVTVAVMLYIYRRKKVDQLHGKSAVSFVMGTSKATIDDEFNVEYANER
eukprot:Pgem_evm1s7385